MHVLQLGNWIAALALLLTVGCSYPHVYCAPDDCGPCNPQLDTLSCSDCGGADCDVPCGRPARGLFTHLGYLASCGGGCGEFYIHPWINERPDECDPCDNHGNWTGPGDCCNRGFWRSFWGDTCSDAGCGSCTTVSGYACDSCGGGHAPAYHGTVHEGHIDHGPMIHESSPGSPSRAAPQSQQPTPAARPSLGPAARLQGTPTPALGTGVQR